MKNPLAVAGIWFLLAVIGDWFIWATYMAVKFISEDAQGQHAAFSLGQANGQVGAVIIIPAFVTVIWTVISGVFANELAE